MLCLAALRRNCKDGEWLCNDGRRCIQEKYICDGKIHCGDGSDNSSALCKTWQCPEGMWKCLNDKCIDEKEVCDGTEQLLAWFVNFKSACRDGSDLTDELCFKWSCSETTWKCKSDNLCIPSSEVCNGEKDCSDGADENEDLCLKWNCSEHLWKCQENRRCLSRYRVCNGIIDCKDGSDEAHCDICPEDKWKCKDGTCINIRYVCDGRAGSYHCPDDSDENVEFCKSFSCPESRWKCKDNITCIMELGK